MRHISCSPVILQVGILLFSVLETSTTFTEESGLLNKHNEEVDRLEKHLKYLGSIQAKPEERASLIRSGLTKIDEILKYPVENKSPSSTKELDCKIKKLALDFAKKISPGKGGTGELKAIFDALELATCKFTFDARGRKYKDFNDDVHGNKFDIFVDQANGKISHDGSFLQPVLDIQSGINLCKTKRVSNVTICKVFVRGGVYHLNEPITVKDDNVNILAYQNEHVSVTSDVVIEPKWKLFESKMETYKGFNPLFEGIKPNQTTKGIVSIGIVKNAAFCQQVCTGVPKCTAFVFFDETTKEFKNYCYIRIDGKWNTIRTSGVISGKKVSIYAADLSEYKLQNVDSIFINDHRAIRARYPNADPETMGLHTIPTGYVTNAEKWLAPHFWLDALEVHIQSPSRKATLFPAFQIGIGGSVAQFDPPQSYWATKKPVGGGGVTYRVPSGLQYSEDLEINLRSWKNPSTGIVHAYQHYHWGNWMFKLDGRNETNKTLHWTLGGFQEARGANDGKEWYVENIFEELDSANEWFYDENTKVLYYYPNLTAADLPNKVSIPQLPCLFQVLGTKSHPVRNTIVQGLTFQHTTKTFLQPYMVPSGGDWSVHKNAVVYIEGSENAVVDKCTFESPEGNGLMVSNYNRGTVLSHNVFYRLGDNGIVLVGDSHLIDGSQGNQPRGTKVLYNLIYENGIWGKQTYPFVQSRSCQSYLEGNVFFNGPRAGININDGFGGGNIINGNLLFNFVRETDDHGPINTWDRVPYLTKVHDEKFVSLNVKENQIHHNFIINNYRSVWPIDHDDGTCYWNDTHNYLVYGGFKNYLGHDKHSMHNIYVYPDRHPGKGASFSYRFCLQTAGQTLGTSGYGDIYRKNKCIMGKVDLYSLGNCNREHLHELIPLLMENNYYTPKAGFLARCGSNKWTLQQFRALGMEIDSVVQDLVGDDEVIQWGKDLLKI